MSTFRSRAIRNRFMQLCTSKDRLSQRDFGLAIFLFTIAVLFIGGFLAYVIVRTTLAGNQQPATLVIPPALWLSTAILLMGSFSIQRALFFVRKEKQQQFRNCLNLTFLLGGAFFIIQVLGLIHVFRQHSEILLGIEQVKNAYHYPSSYGVLFTFVMLHAIHFFVAFGVLGLVIYKAYLFQYDHEYHWGVHACSVVWHFLAVIWVAMLLLFCFVG